MLLGGQFNIEQMLGDLPIFISYQSHVIHRGIGAYKFIPHIEEGKTHLFNINNVLVSMDEPLYRRYYMQHNPLLGNMKIIL